MSEENSNSTYNPNSSRGGYRGNSRGGYRGNSRGGYRGGYQGNNYQAGFQGGYQGNNHQQGYQGGYQGNNYQQGYQGGYQGNNYQPGFQGGYQGNNYQPGFQGGYQGNNYQQGYQGGYQGNNYQQGYQGGFQQQTASAPAQQAAPAAEEPAKGKVSLKDIKARAKQAKEAAAAAAAATPEVAKPVKTEEPKETATEEPKEAAAEEPKEAATEEQKEAPVETVKEEPKEAAAEEQKEAPVETVKEEPKQAVAAEVKEEPKSAPIEASMSKLSVKSSKPVVDIAKEQEDELDKEIVSDMFGGKDHVSILFMGHVDAGKSTMGGNLLYLTGSVDKRTLEKYEREAKDAGRQGWYLSWVMDTNKEERNDGKTIEVGKAYFETDKRRYTILDAPGHKMYVSEMIGGASQADVGVLVISARKGEYETGFEKGGQTREHALLAKTQGVNKMVVVINKMDDTTVNWDKERYDQCVSNLSQYLRAVGYNIKTDVIFMPVSGFTGAGLKNRVDPKDCPWYSGPSLLEYLDSMQTLDRHINAPFMLPISSKMKDLGTIVEGKIESGHIKKGHSTMLMPNKTKVEVVDIYNETEEEVDVAVCGEQVKLRIKGVDEEDIQAGFVMTSPKNPVKVVKKFIATLAIVELKSIISSGFSCVMHVHTAIEEVVITRLLHKIEKGSNRVSKKAPPFAKKGMKVIVEIEVENPVCVETYEDYQQLGRFTLRDQGITIAIGKIIKVAE